MLWGLTGYVLWWIADLYYAIIFSRMRSQLQNTWIAYIIILSTALLALKQWICELKTSQSATLALLTHVQA